MHNLERNLLEDGNEVFTGHLGEDVLRGEACNVERLWRLHPSFHPPIRGIPMPRWQQAYGHDYAFSGTVARALPVPPILEPLLIAVREQIDPRFNGILMNWYDGALGHYIGRHKDSERNIVPGSCYVTISLGETRVFRLRPCGGRGFRDFEVVHGSVLAIPFATNRAWTHEVPRFKRCRKKRISITFRAFVDDDC